MPADAWTLSFTSGCRSNVERSRQQAASKTWVQPMGGLRGNERDKIHHYGFAGRESHHKLSAGA